MVKQWQWQRSNSGNVGVSCHFVSIMRNQQWLRFGNTSRMDFGHGARHEPPNGSKQLIDTVIEFLSIRGTTRRFKVLCRAVPTTQSERRRVQRRARARGVSGFQQARRLGAASASAVASPFWSCCFPQATSMARCRRVFDLADPTAVA